MADKKISQLTAATTPLAGTEVLPVVQGGSTVKVSVDNLTNGKAVSAASFAPTGSTIPANGMYLRATNVLGLATNGAQAVDIDASGNIGVNITNQANHGKFVVSNIGGNTNGAITLLSNDQSTARLRLFNFGASGRDLSFVAGNPGADNTGLTLYDNTNTQNVLRVDNSDNLSVDRGNVIVGTAAKGINFTANTPAAGMTSQLLNWYEEGTFTPTAASETGSITAYTSQGTYVRVGTMVTVRVAVKITTPGTAGGQLTIANLPFTSYNYSDTYRASTFLVREDENSGVAYQGVISKNSTSSVVATMTNGAVSWTANNTYVYEATYRCA